MNSQNQAQFSSVQSQAPTLVGAGELLKRAWGVYKQRFGVFLAIVLIPLLFSLPLLLLNLFTDRIPPFVFLALVIILWLVLIIVSLWSQISLVYAIKEREQKIGVKESLTKGWHKIISYWWVSILGAIITMGGFLLFIIPGIIFAVWFSLAIYILATEDLKGMNALLKSKQLVSGNWWGVFWRFLLLGLLLLVITVLIKNVTESLNISFVGNIVHVLVFPFIAIFGFLIYEDLKRLKTGVFFELPRRGTKAKLILVGILGFLLIPVVSFSIFFVSFNEPRSKARDAVRESHLRMVEVGLELYYSKNNTYPLVLHDVVVANFLKEIPQDPKTNLPYEYTVSANEKEYAFCVDFENKEDRCLRSLGLPKEEIVGESVVLGICPVEFLYMDTIKKGVFGTPKSLTYGVIIIDTERFADRTNILEISDGCGTGIVAKSAADLAGLKPGDIILEINGEKITTLSKILRQYKIGDEVGLKVLRYPYPDSYLASVEDFIKEGNIELVKLRFR